LLERKSGPRISREFGAKRTEPTVRDLLLATFVTPVELPFDRCAGITDRADLASNDVAVYVTARRARNGAGNPVPPGLMTGSDGFAAPRAMTGVAQLHQARRWRPHVTAS
jgi:hypothetical protein